MRPLEDADKNGWTGADFSVMMSDIYACTNRYATCHLRLYTSESDYGGAWLDQAEIKLTGDVQCSAMNLVSNCVLIIIESVSGDTQGSVPILLSLSYATQALNQELWSGVPILLTAGPLWSSLGTLTDERCVDDIGRTVLLPFLLQYLGFIFRKIRPDHKRHACCYELSYNLSNTSLASQITRSLFNRACLAL
ncbi:hypothetical protein TNCV_882731 [Trichonephila clavipes]|nr:hypothetical protein TNCV_882731 [Trichonephila clavipes]